MYFSRSSAGHEPRISFSISITFATVFFRKLRSLRRERDRLVPGAAAFGRDAALGFKLAQGRVDRLLHKPGKGADIAQRQARPLP